MAWEWVAPTATAVVGLGGMRVAWSTARGAQQAQARQFADERAEGRRESQRTERRDAYMAFASEARTLAYLIVLTDTLNEVVGTEDTKLRAKVDEVIEGLRKDYVDTPETAAAFDSAAQQAKSQALEQAPWLRRPLTPDYAMAQIGPLVASAARARLLGSAEVRQEATAVERAINFSLVYVMLNAKVGAADTKKLMPAVERLEAAMAKDLALHDQ